MDESTPLWHVTERRHLKGIMKDGLRAGSYWAASEDLVQYYRECIRMEGQEPVVIQALLSDLLAFSPSPDNPGLEEPITLAIGMGEEEVWDRWKMTSMGWRDCLDLIGSIRLKEPVPPEVFSLKEEPEPRMRRPLAGP